MKLTDIKDKFKELTSDFNKSMNIVLLDPFTSKYDYDFKLFNEIKYMVRDEKEKITREDSKKLQMILDEHLRANGIEYLLHEAIDITDYKKFQAELTKVGKHNPLDKAKAIIKANKDKNPDLYLELSELLERKLLDAKVDRNQVIDEFFSDMHEIINRHKNRHSSHGLNDEKQLVVSTGSRLYYMGKSYYVQMVADEKADRISINFTHSKFHITTPLKYSDIVLHSAIENFYKQKAIEKITPLTKKWAKLMDVTPEHITYQNHSKDFWKLVHKHLNDYKVKEEKIRVFEKLI